MMMMMMMMMMTRMMMMMMMMMIYIYIYILHYLKDPKLWGLWCIPISLYSLLWVMQDLCHQLYKDPKL